MVYEKDLQNIATTLEGIRGTMGGYDRAAANTEAEGIKKSVLDSSVHQLKVRLLYMSKIDNTDEIFEKL